MVGDVPARPLDSSTLAVMLADVGAAVYEMAAGEVRWLRDHDILAGRASSLAARAMIEFLVGRPKGRSKRDIQPSDYHPSWFVDTDQVELLQKRLTDLDARVAHLSLTRVGPQEDAPEGWHDTVLRLLRLAPRFADEISDHPAHEKLAVALDSAEADIERERRRRQSSRARSS
jgi:hypothetical protein